MVKPVSDTETSHKILTAARQVFLLKGMAGARMQDIADAAGINKALLHYYFRNKENLFKTILLEEARKFFPRLNLVFEADIPLFTKIERFAAEYIDEILENPFLPLFIINQINQDTDHFLRDMLSKNQPKPHALLRQIEAEVKKGTIRPIEPEQLLMNLVSMCIFPFMAKPLLHRTLGISDRRFRELMEARKKEVPRFVIAALKK